MTALSDIGRQLQQQGHDYRIEDTVRLPPGTLAAPPYAGVTLEVYPSDVDWKAIERFRLINKIPSITFGVDLSQRKVAVFVNPNCESGSSIIRTGPWTIKNVNYYDLNEVTKEIINHEVKEFLPKIPFAVELID